jgi:hypothetical protein
MTQRHILSISWGLLALTGLLNLGGFTPAGAEFGPSVERKKILLMDGPPAEEARGLSQGVAIDGLLIGGPMIMFYPCKPLPSRSRRRGGLGGIWKNVKLVAARPKQ